MSRCFKISNNLSAKEYTRKRANQTIFCNLRKKYLGNNKKATSSNSACLNKEGKMYHFSSNVSQINMKKAFETFSEKYRSDLSKNYLGQNIKNHFKFDINNPLNNSDISNNFTEYGPINTAPNGFSIGQTVQIDCSGTYITKYAEIKNNTPTDITGTNPFKNSKQINYDYCAVKKSNEISVLKDNE
jgi:hypothetical protein